MKVTFTNSLTLALPFTLAASFGHAQTVLEPSVDAIIRDNLCLGEGCPDTSINLADAFASALIITDLRTRIDFEDTSVDTDAFPTNDWSIVANEPFSSGRDILFFEDRSGGTRPFLIEAGARTNAIYIDDTSNIGIGTSLPQQNLHMINEGATSIRMETTGVFSGFVDLATSAGNFVIGDLDADELPFVILQTAPDASLWVGNGGDIGLGLRKPEVPLHVLRDSGGAPTDMMRLENNGGVVFRLKDTSAGGQEFTFQSNGGIFRIASPEVPGPEFTMDDFGNVTITGEITTAGSCNAGCDRVFDAGYDLPDMTDHHAKMWELGHLPNVGPTSEDGPMNLSEKVGGMLNELEHAHIFIQQQQQQIEHQAALIQEMQATHVAQITELTARLNTLEANK